MAHLVGLVLAGGSGRRMGRPKGDLLFDGVPLALRAANTLRKLCPGVVISIGPAGHNPAPGHPAVEDVPPGGRGPLAGIHSGFEATGTADLLVLACDYPRVDVELLTVIVGRSADADDVTLVSDAGDRDHPLVALWRREAACAVARALSDGRYKVRELLRGLRVGRLGPPAFQGLDLARVLVNLNSPHDVDGLTREDGHDPP